MPQAQSSKKVEERCNETGAVKDIHEKDVEYLNNCREAAGYACKKLGWKRIQCSENGEPLPIEVISDAVFEAVSKAIGL